MGEVKVFRIWRSPFSWRVELALKLKGVAYEVVEEDLKNKSELLIKYNPVHMKIPVFLHHGKPIVESLVILEYIDEVWKENPLLPSDSFERAHARFWANFIDNKILPARNALVRHGIELEKAREELFKFLKIFEKEIEGKRVKPEDKIGYFDIVTLLVCYWVPPHQEALGENVLNKESFPGIYSWSDGLLNHPFMKENLPDMKKLVASHRVKFGTF